MSLTKALNRYLPNTGSSAGCAFGCTVLAAAAGHDGAGLVQRDGVDVDLIEHPAVQAVLHVG